MIKDSLAVEIMQNFKSDFKQYQDKKEGRIKEFFASKGVADT